jgi:site-specific recombinase XerD
MTDATPTTTNRTLPRRQPNAAYRQREYLTEKEVDWLIEAARKRGRNGARDAAAILLAYRHGLRAAELCVGLRLIFAAGDYTSIAQRAGSRACIRCMGQS